MSAAFLKRTIALELFKKGLVSVGKAIGNSGCFEEQDDGFAG